MISTFECDQSAPITALITPPLPGDFQGHFHRRGPVIGKEESFELGAFRQSVGELLSRRVAEVGEDHLLQGEGLAPNRFGDAGFGVAVQSHPPTADRIDQHPSILQMQGRAFGTGHIQGLRVQCHLGGGVPEMGVPGHHDGLKRPDQICR